MDCEKNRRYCRNSNIFELWSVITIQEEWKILKLWGSVAMYLAMHSFFPYFLEYCIRQETNFSHLIKLLLKKEHSEKPSFKTYFPVGTRSKTSFLTSTTALGSQQMSKIQSRLVAKRKIIEAICLINQIICEMHLILESHTM